MKGKRHTTEQKIRILREADGGKSIVEVCRDKNLFEGTFPHSIVGRSSSGKWTSMRRSA